MISLRWAVVLVFCGTALGCGSRTPLTLQDRLGRATSELARATTEEQRFYALGDVAKLSFALGKTEDAGKHAQELLGIVPKFRGNWNYGNAVHDANVVLGRIAVREGRLDEGKRHLIAAGRSPGSPQLNSFGPNMSLAKDLLEKGERDAVQEYFALCRRFWKMDRGQLDSWAAEVRSGKIPDFGANLVY